MIPRRTLILMVLFEVVFILGMAAIYDHRLSKIEQRYQECPSCSIP